MFLEYMLTTVREHTRARGREHRWTGGQEYMKCYRFPTVNEMFSHVHSTRHTRTAGHVHNQQLAHTAD